jgi:predicted GNAT family N-acyltransferase
VLEHYAALAPEALDSLTAEELHKLYKMLRLKVFVAKSGDSVIELAGMPAESTDANSSSITEVTSRSARTGARS